MVHCFDEAWLGVFCVCQQVKMELFSHFPQYMKNLTRAWDMVGHLQDGKKATGHRNISRFSETSRGGFIDKVSLFLDEIKTLMWKSSKIPKISIAVEVMEVLP